jgi:hypothetical protein
MADKDGRIEIDGAVQLIFNDACKNIADLKARQWQAATLSIAGIAGIATFSHGSEKPCQLHPALTDLGQEVLTAFIVLILVGYLFVMWRCYKNLEEFKSRLKTIVKDKFPQDMSPQDKSPEEAKKRFYIVDEGTIVAVAYFAVVVAFLFAILDIWNKL